jgi:hypothetical protein
VTFTELLVTSAQFLLQEPVHYDRPKSTRLLSGTYDALNWQFIIDVSDSVLLPSATSNTVMFCVYCVGYCTEARGGTVG